MTAEADAQLEQLRMDSASGMPEALYRLAAALVTRGQPEAAYPLHVRAAEADHAPAQVELARMQLHERGEKWLATLWIRQGRYRAF